MRAAYWLEVSVACDGEAAEAVADFLQPFAHGGSVVIEQLGDPAGADPAALAAELTVKIFLPAEQDRPELRQRIAEGLYHLNRLHPIPAPVFQELEDEDWAEAWKRHFVPFRAGRRLWIQPSWQPAEAVAPAAVVLTLDPGMAFGTGTHPSTQLCLWALEELVWPSCTLLDVGTGSGILGIAAALLGAGRVLAMDTDWDAARAARANARLNAAGSQMHVFQGSLAAVAPSNWDIVVVNILAPVIVELLTAGRLMEFVAASSWLILSGIITDQQAQVEAAVAAAGGRVERALTADDWVTLLARKIETP